MVAGNSSCRSGWTWSKRSFFLCPCAFLGSCNSTRKLTSLLIGTDIAFTVPTIQDDEELFRSMFSSEYRQIDVNTASQKLLQSVLDKKSHLKSLDSVSFRNRARLNTLGTSSAGPGLWDIPNFSLRLIMSKEEFILAVHLWFGCQPFPSPPSSLQCLCGQIIDHFGDHILGCSHGPLRIRWHDALSDIIWHALLVDNQGATREQICGANNN